MLSSAENQKITLAGELSAVDKFALRAAIAALDLLKTAAADCQCSVDELDGDRLVQWAMGKPQTP